jgi:ribonuclease Z
LRRNVRRDAAGVRLTFLGTSAGTPTRARNVTGQALQFDDGRLWLLDCGEATQHQLIRTGLRASRIDRILVTHLHGDHCYGLPGVLSLAAISGRSEPVELVGPDGTAELVRTVLRLSHNHLPYRLDIRELGAGGTVEARGQWSWSAWPLRHRVPSFGYVLQEAPRPGRFHPDRAQALGIPAGPLYRRLQDGQAVTLADGRTIQPAAVCEPPRRGRKLVLLGDTADSRALADAGRDCDLLVHEATYDARREDKAIQWGHSTSTMAGRFAAELRARALVLTHFSGRFQDGDDDGVTVPDLVREAQAACPGTRVFAAEDGWTHEIGAGDDPAAD